MRRRSILIGTLAIAVVLVASGVVVYTLHARAQADASYPGLHEAASVTCPGPADPISSQGGTAIRPRNDCTPSFTQQDARDYMAHSLSLGTITTDGQPTVTRVVFLTIGDLGRVSGDSEWEANYPGSMLVCYAQLKGTFYISGPPGATLTPDTTAFIVFDAHTGNQLVVGTGARLG